jgi:hypothetical protein
MRRECEARVRTDHFATASMHAVASATAICGECGTRVPYPCLGDFSYGAFILWRSDGKAFRHLAAIGHPVWEEVERILSVAARGDQLQEVVARIADRDDGRAFTLSMVCPACGSRRFRSWGGERSGFIDVPDATFSFFASLPMKSKAALVRSKLLEIDGERGDAPPLDDDGRPEGES